METYERYQKAFTEKAIQNGYSVDEINKCLNYSKPIIEKGIPVIYNTSHLSALVGFNKKYLKRASAHTSSFYKRHVIPKKNKKLRILDEPLPNLKEIQYWILNNILNKIKISRYAKAYTSGRNIKDHVKYHKSQKMVLTLDIKDFFTNITSEHINSFFIQLGYSNYVANLLTKLCCLNNSLPQGAPTSPILSNIIMKPFDEVISTFCKNSNLRYSRYADDLAFSSDKIDVNELTTLINSNLNIIGLKLNESKTMLMSNNQRQIISGIITNSKIQVPREKRDELRQAIYYIEKFGLENHLSRIQISKANYIRHLLGLANYVSFINPKDEKNNLIKLKLYEMLDKS